MAQPQRGTRLAHVVRGRRHQEDAVDLNNDGLAEVSQLGRARQRAPCGAARTRRCTRRRGGTHRPRRFQGTLSVSLPSKPAWRERASETRFLWVRTRCYASPASPKRAP